MPPSRLTPARTVVAVIGCSLITAITVTGCGSDGRNLRPAKPTQTQSVYTATTTTVAATTVTSIDGTKAATVGTATTLAPGTIPFALQLPWADEGLIDVRFTCNGDDVHPRIAWIGAPAETVEIALVVTDPDADDFVHWIIAGLDPNNPLLDEGAVPVGAIEGENGFSTASAPTVGWRGPCPPAGTTHRYRFTLYALGQQVELPTGAASADLLAVIESSSIDASEITGVYPAPSVGSPTTGPAPTTTSALATTTTSD